MSTASIRLCTAAVAASAALALVLTGCGDSKSASQPAAPAPASPTAAGPVSPGPSGGASAVSVDGAKLTGTFDTTCAKQGDVLALALTDAANGTYGNLAVAATVTGTGTVQAVGITGSKGGSNGLPYAIGFGKGQPGGSAEAVKSGNTFHVTGEGVGTPDLTNPTAGPKSQKFDITFACSTIVGG
ncbi:lipoprotein LpqH [Nocardia sp. alder85J]|uniref:lipoprotein LpqH n=1 Tax=Nocardia sp. alder85J TaxID=2862949 RepID=UPI001CD7984F|nr:lipoprotein LpqH [Nocardia sp. alder85J]MCX4096357.1 lipoprotein LpqH [Nocardia sp. alder85J]